jgi:diguanylate cyclase (GGDEF)-like protein
MVILKATRLGGDEFVVVCEDSDAARAHMVVDRILRTFDEPIVISGTTLRLTVSIGLTLADGHRHAADLLREADAAM